MLLLIVFSFNPTDKSRFGFKMLEKSGWSEGDGLGAARSGRTDSIRVSVRSMSSIFGDEALLLLFAKEMVGDRLLRVRLSDAKKCPFLTSVATRFIIFLPLCCAV
jgi:hypothetical protein